MEKSVTTSASPFNVQAEELVTLAMGEAVLPNEMEEQDETEMTTELKAIIAKVLSEDSSTQVLINGWLMAYGEDGLALLKKTADIYPCLRRFLPKKPATANAKGKPVEKTKSELEAAKAKQLQKWVDEGLSLKNILALVGIELK
jgi:hypothetical protein